MKDFNFDLYKKIKLNWDKIAKPLDGMGKFEELISRIGAIKNEEKPDISNKVIVIFCADNGIVEEGVSQSPKEVTRICAQNIAANKTTVGIMAREANAGLLVVDVGIEYDGEIPSVENYKVRKGTRNFAKEPALTKEEVEDAINVGKNLTLALKNKGVSILAIGEMGIGNTTTTSAVAAGLLKMSADEVTGRGAGLSDAGLVKKRKVIDAAIKKYDLYNLLPEEILEKVGGLDIAAMTGMCLGAKEYGIPVVLDGVISQVAALLAEKIEKGTKEFLIPSHISKEPVSIKICKELGLEPVIDARMALGEGTGAALMLSLLNTANCIYLESVPFEASNVEQYTRY